MPSKKPFPTAIPPQPADVPAELEPDFAEIAEVAYLLWLDRGGEHGQDSEDWIRAIEIVRSRNGK